MGAPVVKSTNGYGLPVTVVSKDGAPIEIAPNGFGMPIIEVPSGGLPVTYVGGNQPTVPAAFTAGQWSVADAATGGTATVTISALPNNGGSANTAIQCQVGAGSWTNSGVSSTGSFNITGLTNGVSVNIMVRAVNAVGNGPDSDTKSVTPTLAPSYDPEAQAYFNVMSPALSNDRKDLVNTFVLAGKSAGWWPKLDVIRLLAQTGSNNSRINLKNPSAPMMSGFNGPAFTDDRGWEGDAMSSYMGSGLVFTDPNQFLQDSATMGTYINATPSDVNNNNPALGMDVTSGTLTFLRPKDPTGGMGGRINANTNDNSVAVPSRLGFKAVTRKDANTIQWYGPNGATLGGALTKASAPMQTKELLLFRLGTGYGADRQAFMFAGGALTDAEMQSLYNSINTYLTAIGAN